MVIYRKCMFEEKKTQVQEKDIDRKFWAKLKIFSNKFDDTRKELIFKKPVIIITVTIELNYTLTYVS